MIRYWVSGLLLVFVLASPAVGQSSKQNQSPTSSSAPASAPAPKPAAPAFTPIPPPPPTSDQCRASCAQTYYFCLSENEQQDCAPQWSQCRLACGTTAPTGRLLPLRPG